MLVVCAKCKQPVEAEGKPRERRCPHCGSKLRVLEGRKAPDEPSPWQENAIRELEDPGETDSHSR